MKVLRLTASNVLGISEIDWDFEGHSLWLVGGRNGQGKTSAIKSLIMALCGRSGMADYPEIPLRDGESEGVITVELSGSEELHEDTKLTAELRFTRKRSGAIQEQFRLFDSTGEDAPEPRTLLKRLYRAKGFDPLAFERMPAKEQRKVLLECLGIDLTADEEIRKNLYDDRTTVNRMHKQAEARLKSMDVPRNAPKKPVDTTLLASELTKAQKHNEEIRETKRRLDASEQKLKKYEEEIANLEDRIANLRETCVAVQDDIHGFSVTLAEMEPVDESAIVQQISEASEQNSLHQKAMLWDAAKEEANRLKKQSNELTEALDEIDANQRKMLAEADWPMPGMCVDDQGVTINGVPFQQCSQSERIRASLEIGMLMHPELRLLVCEDGSALDMDALQEVERIAQEKDYLVLVEVVTRSDGDEGICTVVIEDGKAKSNEETQLPDGDVRRPSKPQRGRPDKAAAPTSEVLQQAEEPADA